MQLINFVQASFLLLVIVLATVHGPLTWKRLNPFTCGSFLTFFFFLFILQEPAAMTANWHRPTITPTTALALITSAATSNANCKPQFPTSQWLVEFSLLFGSLIFFIFIGIFSFVQASWANQYNVQRPGLANLFFDSASEEREHALKLLGYLRMRGHNELDILPSTLVIRFY